MKEEERWYVQFITIPKEYLLKYFYLFHAESEDCSGCTLQKGTAATSN